MTAVGHDDLLVGFTGLRAQPFEFLHNVHSLDHRSENNVPVIQPGRFDSGDEELRPVGIRASISHREDAGAGVFQGEVFIGEFGTVDGLAPSAVVVGEVTALTHEIGDDTMEGGAFVPKSGFPSAEGTEVFAGLGNHI